MALISSDPKIPEYRMTWKELRERLGKIPRKKGTKIYGIRPGGKVLAGLLEIMDPKYFKSVENPNEANCFIESIFESSYNLVKHARAYPGLPYYGFIRRVWDSDAPAPDAHLGKVIFPWEIDSNAVDEDSFQATIIKQLKYIGENSEREGLRKTPFRVMKAWEKIYGGYKESPEKLLKVTFTDKEYNQMVVIRNIELYSTCEHHMLPFFGRAHVAYLPNGRLIGASKLARLVEVFSRRLQIQERICQQIVNALTTHLRPMGAACVIQAQHFCMTSRGVEKQHSEMVTSALSGAFLDQADTREEFMRLIK